MLKHLSSTLGYGFLETVCQNAFLIELTKVGLHAEKEERIKVFYNDHLVGEYAADILVEDNVILELKSVKDLHPAHTCPVQFTSVTAQRI